MDINGCFWKSIFEIIFLAWQPRESSQLLVNSVLPWIRTKVSPGFWALNHRASTLQIIKQQLQHLADCKSINLKITLLVLRTNYVVWASLHSIHPHEIILRFCFAPKVMQGQFLVLCEVHAVSLIRRDMANPLLVNTCSRTECTVTTGVL